MGILLAFFACNVIAVGYCAARSAVSFHRCSDLERRVLSLELSLGASEDSEE